MSWPSVGGAIIADAALPAPRPEWFDPAAWGEAARPVAEGGRGAAWYVDAPFGAALLRHYRRGGLAAKISRDRYVWRGEAQVRSVAEWQLTRSLFDAGLPVARPLAAFYAREGRFYRAAILLQRLHDVRPLAALASDGVAPWAATGDLVARFHRAGLDHADLNAHNILFDRQGQGWLIDFDRSRLRRPSRAWREANLARLLRSLQKLRGGRSRDAVDADFARLREAYDRAWSASE
ncbi:MAG: 3-deoxy-D-manno-octulosonic acid kinase [Pseudoxanthomonas suwonensis]|nr:3-deoxy-D-manno-octulosonic acid kinase [Pseudoxanthomonas suwonensis]